MKLKLHVVVSLAAVALLVAMGLYSMKASEQLLKSFEQEEKHVKAAVEAAAEISSYAKRAEGHLMLYLALHRTADREKYPKRIESLQKNIAILDRALKHFGARGLLNRIKARSADCLSVGNGLIAHHDTAMAQTGAFDMTAHRETIFRLHEKFSGIRRLGVEMVALLVNAEEDLKASIYRKAVRLRHHMFVFVALAAGILLYTGYVLSKTIITLNKEIAIRIQSEQAVHAERNKLEDALAEVKVLSGLIPICVSCKKIRDDKGYWNQIEAYISQHSDAEFSHGICPECATKHYAEFTHDEE